MAAETGKNAAGCLLFFGLQAPEACPGTPAASAHEPGSKALHWEAHGVRPQGCV